MPDDKKIAVYNDVFSLYQEMNFISPDDLEYERKMRYKKALVTLNVDELNSQRLVVTAGYDLQDMLESGNKQGIKDTVSFIQDNVQGMNPENLSLLKGGLEYIPV
jgi:excinuclease UvrABC helicase subunit UvrB